VYLHELRLPVSKVRGVGPATERAFAQLGIIHVRDLLYHLPREYEDRKETRPLATAMQSGYANTVAQVVAHDYIGFGPKRTLKVYIKDSSATASLVCFGRNFLADKLQPGARIFLAGTFSYRYKELQSSSFEFEPYSSQPRIFGTILPIYGLTEGLSQHSVRQAVRNALATYGAKVQTLLPTVLRKRHQLSTTAEALACVHRPQRPEEAETGRRTLAFEELFVLQLGIARRALERKNKNVTGGSSGTTLPLSPLIRGRESLPFALTSDQETAVTEIVDDLQDGAPMARLLQGDVGSGKTLVAFLSALPVIQAGYQVVFMAPTELLARQHATNADRFLGPLGVNVGFLSGSLGQAARGTLLQAIAVGTVNFIVGTHAVFTPEVAFARLRYVIVDEQHRFGVLQRSALLAKGEDPDLLLMTATPIPRTLALTVFGDMATSTIRKMPPGRRPVETHLAREGNEQKVYDWVRRELTAGRQAYFVYPLIERSDKSELKAAEHMYEFLSREIFPDFSVGLIHSRVREDEKERRMHDFVSGKTAVLVATSVVEVGVDVSNATCMVVEHAQQFGLAALHQLRGRVGRGSHQSYAFLIYSTGLTEEAKKRLKVMMDTTDGFQIAEQDLIIRGPGDIAGIRQSGYLRLHVADLGRDMDIMNHARKAAFELLGEDPGLLNAEHAGLRDALTGTEQEENAL